jgi:hypothetical protein
MPKLGRGNLDREVIWRGRVLELALGTQFRAAEIPGLEPAAADGVVAEVTSNPKNPSMLGITNRSRTAWQATAKSIKSKPTRPPAGTPPSAALFNRRLQGQCAEALSAWLCYSRWSDAPRMRARVRQGVSRQKCDGPRIADSGGGGIITPERSSS